MIQANLFGRFSFTRTYFCPKPWLLNLKRALQHLLPGNEIPKSNQFYQLRGSAVSSLVNPPTNVFCVMWRGPSKITWNATFFLTRDLPLDRPSSKCSLFWLDWSVGDNSVIDIERRRKTFIKNTEIYSPKGFWFWLRKEIAISHWSLAIPIT